MSTETVQPTAPSFPFLTIHTVDGPLSVPCEPIGTHFAITPELYVVVEVHPDAEKDRATAGARLEGTFVVSLYPSGQRLDQGAGCIRCARRAALEWEKLPLDWASLAPLPSFTEEWKQAQPQEALMQFAMTRDLAFGCDTSYCDPADTDDRSFPMGDTVAVPESILAPEPAAVLSVPVEAPEAAK